MFTMAPDIIKKAALDDRRLWAWIAIALLTGAGGLGTFTGTESARTAAIDLAVVQFKVAALTAKVDELHEDIDKLENDLDTHAGQRGHRRTR